MLKKLLFNLTVVNSQIAFYSSRSKYLNKFYKTVSVAKQNKDNYQILLDNKAVKTPSGQNLIVNNDLLAQAIAHEWSSQTDRIVRHTMHLTNLTNTVIDNPTGRSKDTIVKGLMEFLDTDTLCFRCSSPNDLFTQQCLHWDPVLNYIRRQYGISPVTTTKLDVPSLPAESRLMIERHLLDYDLWGLTGFQHCIETLKSVYLSLALVDGYISVEEAVFLSRLEAEYQSQKWGDVEWHHEVEQVEMKSRVAAAYLLLYTCNNRRFLVQKQ